MAISDYAFMAQVSVHPYPDDRQGEGDYETPVVAHATDRRGDDVTIEFPVAHRGFDLTLTFRLSDLVRLALTVMHDFDRQPSELPPAHLLSAVTNDSNGDDDNPAAESGAA